MPRSRASSGPKRSIRKATNRQIEAIHSIGMERGYATGPLADLAAQKFGVESLAELSVRQAICRFACRSPGGTPLSRPPGFMLLSGV